MPGQLYAPYDIQVSATGAAAQQVATLPGVPGKQTYLLGFVVTGSGATSAGLSQVAVTGIQGTMQFSIVVPAIATTPAIPPLIIVFPRPIPASAINTAIVVTVPTFGAGNTVTTVTAWGFQE